MLTAFIIGSATVIRGQNKIDSLRSDKDVIVFIQDFYPHFDGGRLKAKKKNKTKGKYSRHHMQQIAIADSLQVRYWVKADMDNNGDTDLVLMDVDSELPYIFAIVIRNKSYQLVTANYHCKYQNAYPVVKKVDSKNVVLMYHQNVVGYDYKTGQSLYSKLSCDTLTVKHYLFLNFVPSPKLYEIERIEIDNNGFCEGECPKIDITINPIDGKSSCTKEAHWLSKKYVGELSFDDIQKIKTILDYSNFEDLQNSYTVNCIDQTTTTLKITYNGGKIKKINDYGSSGNFTLREIYRITENIKWSEK